MSSTDRVIGPSLSIDHESVMHPARLTRPNVGRRPDAPQARHGETMLPRVSEPIAKPTSPAATVEADPADEPLDPRRGSQGLRVIPPCQRSPCARAPMLSLATRTAPASSSRAATVAFSVMHLIPKRHCAPGGRVAGVGDQVLGAPGDAVQRAAINPGGDLGVGLAGLLERQVFGQGHHGLEERVEALEPGEVELGQLGGRDLPGPDQARTAR